MMKLSTITILLFILLLSHRQVQSQWVQTNGPYNAYVQCLAHNSTHIFAGTYGAGLFVSTDRGMSWKLAHNTFRNSTIRAVAVDENRVYVITSENLLYSSNSGTSWVQLFQSPSITSVLIDGNRVYVGSKFGVITSTDNISWTDVSDEFLGQQINSMVLFETDILVGSLGLGLFYSSDHGENWVNITNDLPTEYITKVSSYQNHIYVGTDKGVYRSIDTGKHWTSLNKGILTTSTFIGDIIVNDQLAIVSYDHNQNSGVVYSTDQGETWIPSTDGLKSPYILAFDTIDGNIFSGTGYGISVSTNMGISWTDRNQGLSGIEGKALVMHDNTLIAAANERLYSTTDNGNTWNRFSTYGKDDVGFINDLFIDNSVLYIADAGNGMAKLQLADTTWQFFNDGLESLLIWNLGSMGDHIFTGGWQYYMHRSTNAGTSWEYHSDGIFGGGVTGIITLSDRLIISTGGGNGYGGIFVSFDSGMTWENIGEGLGSTNIFDLTLFDSILFAATYNRGIYYSTDQGYNWTVINTGLDNPNTVCIYSVGSGLITSTETGIYYLPRGAKTWISLRDGFPGGRHYIYTAIVSGEDILIGTDIGFWKRPIKEIEAKYAVLSLGTSERPIRITPNPSDGNFMIENLPEFTERISIRNLLGSEIRSKSEPYSDNTWIDLTDAPAGMYYLEVIHRGGRSIQIILKQ